MLGGIAGWSDCVIPSACVRYLELVTQDMGSRKRFDDRTARSRQGGRSSDMWKWTLGIRIFWWALGGYNVCY